MPESHSNYNISNNKLNITNLLPYKSYLFVLNKYTHATFCTDEAKPEGFDESNISIESQLTTMNISWEQPTRLNGQIRNVAITASESGSGSKSKRSTDISNFSMEASGSVILRNLTINTAYTVSVIVFNK